MRWRKPIPVAARQASRPPTLPGRGALKDEAAVVDIFQRRERDRLTASSNARSFRPRAASIKPGRRARAITAAPARSSAGREPLQTQGALFPSLSYAPAALHQAGLRTIVIRPSRDCRPATSASFNRSRSRSARAQSNQMSAAVAMAPDPCARSHQSSGGGRVSAFQQR